MAHVYSLGIAPAELEDVDLRRPLQGFGKQPDRGPQALPGGDTSPDLDPAELEAELAVRRHRAGREGEGPSVVGGRRPGEREPEKPVVERDGLGHVALLLPVDDPMPGIAGVPPGRVQLRVLEAVLEYDRAGVDARWAAADARGPRCDDSEQ
jgi:hypothetical protein